MTGLSENLTTLDRLIHEPARLAIMTALSSCQYADFLFLQRLTGLTAGNLSSHLTKLETAGLVWVNKQIVGKRPRTTTGLTEKGRAAVKVHWKQLEKLRLQAETEGKQKNKEF
jgi:DNA-binding HxlR family transcriptional regulator